VGPRRRQRERELKTNSPILVALVGNERSVEASPLFERFEKPSVPPFNTEAFVFRPSAQVAWRLPPPTGGSAT